MLVTTVISPNIFSIKTLIFYLQLQFCKSEKESENRQFIDLKVQLLSYINQSQRIEFRIDENNHHTRKTLFHYEAMLACKIRLVCALLQESLAAEEPEAWSWSYSPAAGTSEFPSSSHAQHRCKFGLPSLAATWLNHHQWQRCAAVRRVFHHWKPAAEATKPEPTKVGLKLLFTHQQGLLMMPPRHIFNFQGLTLNFLQ